MRLPAPRLIVFRLLAMELFTKLFGDLLVFVYHCFDRIVVDFPLLQRIALPITIGSIRYSGIKFHDTRIIRLMEVLLHGGTHLGGWTAKEIHQVVIVTFGLSDRALFFHKRLCGPLANTRFHHTPIHNTPTASAKLPITAPTKPSNIHLLAAA
jgi:hypothetical protein